MTAATPIRPGPIAVAIVDDDASVRLSLRRLCEVFGLVVTSYASGKEFLAAVDAKADQADCLLLDAHMPEMTGLEVTRHLDARGLRIPTIIFTGDDTPDVSTHFIATGVTSYLRKPVSATILIAEIERAASTRNKDLPG
jgi:FixJ family two-component response regulator